MIKCPNCGQENTAGSTFCAFCGYKFDAPAATPPPSTTPPPTPGSTQPMGSSTQPPGQQSPPPAASYQPPPSAPAPMGSGADAMQAVQGPAIGLMIFAGVNALQSIVFVIVGIVGSVDPSIFDNGMGTDVDPMMNVIVAILMGIVMLGASGLIFYGAMKMKALEGFSMAMAAAIAAVVPCVTIYCCIPGIALGIWALVVLNKPEVKSSFR